MSNGTTYRLGFREEAKKEWDRLTPAVREQFKKKLLERCDNPRPPAAKLNGAKDRYKIKLASAGYRLVYEVRDAELLILVIAIGRRDKSAVYRTAERR